MAHGELFYWVGKSSMFINMLECPSANFIPPDRSDNDIPSYLLCS